MTYDLATLRGPNIDQTVTGMQQFILNDLPKLYSKFRIAGISSAMEQHSEINGVKYPKPVVIFCMIVAIEIEEFTDEGKKLWDKRFAAPVVPITGPAGDA